ncbi:MULTISPECIES: hypothetical protein [unclassified Pseudomonas]|uniref:hypothetical protein n=1 Tax=unclassified Pseudomonas TaxID=196821 RepID=UPI0011144E46|nr:MULTISPECIES: hypothetical protein [unclassified Pseudomonas]
MKKLSDLHEVFVSFNAEKIEGTSIVFFNKDLKINLAEEEILSKYSYIVGGRGIAGAERNEKIFYAERYGGDGIYKNGGGGRCGFDGVYQLKGIGPNELVGHDSDEAHGNGFLSVDAAIYESIWAEIINIALPYGAVRTIAVIDAGCKFSQEGQTYSRALLVREPTVRPAHFMRAIYFKEKFTGSLSSDARRVQAAVQKLVDFLPICSCELSTLSDRIRIRIGLIELARRYARQFSAARAKKIIHYNVSASNISLNGAWMDLSGARVFSNLIGCDKLDLSEFLTEYEPALRSLYDICHYLKKYEVIDVEFQGDIFQSAINEFWGEYQKCLRFYNAVQVGFPGFFLTKVAGSRVFLEFSSCLQRLLDLGCYELVDRTQELGWKGYEYEMAHVYIHALKMKIFNGALDAFFASGTNVSLVNEFFCVYGRLFDLVVECAEREGIDRKCFTVAMAINVTRLNRRPYMISGLKECLSKIERCVGLGGDPPFNSFERAVKHWSTLVFSCGADLKIPFWVGEKMRVFYDIASGVFVVKRCEGDIFIKSLCKLWDEIEVGDVMSFYKNVWSILNEEF